MDVKGMSVVAQKAVVDVAKYPYLVDLPSFIKSRFGPVSYEVVLLRREVVERTLRRFKEALEKGIMESSAGSGEVEVLAFHLGLLLASLLKDKWVVSRYALAEAERSYRLLMEEDERVIEFVGRMLGLDIVFHGDKGYKQPIGITLGGVVIYREYPFSMNFFHYVKVARRLLGDPKWKPINLPVLRGRVYLTKDMVVRVLKEAIMEYIEGLAAKLSEERFEKIPDELTNLLAEVRKIVEESKPKPKVLKRGEKIYVKVPKGVIIEEAFPPCMRDILDKARRGEHLSHHERFAIATFLLNLGMDIDRVVDIFRTLPDFNEKIARYQVEHLAGLRGSRKKYFTYGCEKMRALGLCKAECGTRSPIHAYYRRLSELVKKGVVKLEETTKATAISGSDEGEAGSSNVG